MPHQLMPQNLIALHFEEEKLRKKTIDLLNNNKALQMHLSMIETSMDVTDIFRQYETDDEDLKVIQFLGMRVFNAFSASIKLCFSGYYQTSLLILRDVLETVFLIDLFRGDRKLIETWRNADKTVRLKKFSPVKVRESLDKRDRCSDMKRKQKYDLFSELAAHPTMQSVQTMRPNENGDAVSGPFLEKRMVEAVVSEMGKLAAQIGVLFFAFIPNNFYQKAPTMLHFDKIIKSWMAEFSSTPPMD
jgi:hypothetical protein